MPKRLLVSALALVALMAASPARAHDLAPFLRDHRDLPQVQRLIVLHERLHRMIARYEALERQAGHTWIEVVDAEHDVADALATSEAAEADLAARVRAAYQFGAGGAVEALLSAGSFADAATISEYTARTITLRNDILRDSSVAQAAVVAKRAEAQARRSSLEPELNVLRRLMTHMQATVNEATDLAHEAAIADDVLQAQRALVAAAAARMGTWDLIGYQDDQSPLLTLLGPTGGRTCDTPEGLAPTGEVFDGYASWYGWEFGGQPTATGAIFDPRLFTAANRSLPFGTFLRVSYGGKCAIVLVNDRGPYGRLERVIDLSQAAAEYLGVGVSWVHAEILVPTSRI
ncbi:MAG TPA: septal ring lytic transglycosylase RlpA family protein [Actinomycetota bacterium]|nr:septal ring lytic transglycosylase RlpA family protein [Actinomycetota bacterium]